MKFNKCDYFDHLIYKLIDNRIVAAKTSVASAGCLAAVQKKDQQGGKNTNSQQEITSIDLMFFVF